MRFALHVDKKYFIQLNISFKSISFRTIFTFFCLDFKFLTALHFLECPDHAFTVFRKCPSMCLCLTLCERNCVDALSQELMHGI